MASTQRFEGTNLETLLGEVRSVAGSDIRIVEANRLLRGGIAGFFAKERFEVVIELPDPDASAAESSALATEQMHLLRLADAASDVERRAMRSSAIGRALDPHNLPSVLDAWAQDERESDIHPEPPITTSAGAAPKPTPTPTPMPTPTPTTFDHVLDRIAGLNTLTEPTPLAPSRYREHAAVLGAHPSVARADVGAPRAPESAARIPPDRRRTVITNQLVGLGLPKRWVDDADLAGEPIDVIARIVSHYAPRPRRLGCDGVIAIVGDAHDAFRVAHRLAEELGLYAGDIHGALTGRRPSFLAPAQWLAGPDVALERRRTWAARGGITLVVLGAGMGREGQQWCREMLHALRPDETWAVVEASRKPEDIEAWSAKVGHIDALAVCRADESVSPAAVLAAGIPVTRIDNRPATPTGWGLLLADRLADQPQAPTQALTHTGIQPGVTSPGNARVTRSTSAA